MFDRLQTASFLGGYNASISGNMPAMSHYVTTGLDPFVAVYSAVEVGMVFFYIHLKADIYGTTLLHATNLQQADDTNCFV